ncbi:MAG: zinc-binding dehydrogenase [bacterium]
MIPSDRVVHKWLIHKAGSLKRLVLVSEQLPEPAKDDVQVAVKAVGLNFADIFACLGLYSATPAGAFTPGLEFCGTVSALGESSQESPHGFRVGDPVIGMTRFGAFATHITINHHYLLPLQDGWTFEQGAAFPVQGLTAWYGLVELGNLSENQVVLVQSAAGGVGLQAMDIIQKQDATAIAVIGSPEKAAILRERTGIDPSQILVRRKAFKTDLQQVLNRLSRDGLDIVFDAVYGKFFKPAYEALNPAGRYVLYGAADLMSGGNRPNYLSLIPKYLMRPRLDPMAMITANRNLMAFNLIWLWENIPLMHRVLSDFMASNPAPPHVGRQFDFSEAPAALRFFQKGRSTGKIVLKVNS